MTTKSKTKKAIGKKTIDFDHRCLICTDLDGTMLDSNCSIPLYTRKVVHKLTEMGHLVCIFTARARRSSIHYYNVLGLKTPLVNYNGASTHIPKDPTFIPVHFYMNKQIIKKIFSDKIIYPMVYNVLFENIDATYFLNSFGDKSPAEIRKSLVLFNIYTSKNIKVIKSNFSKLKHGAFSILVTLKDAKNVEAFAKRVHELCPSVVVRAWTEEHVGVIIEINSTFPSKGMALRMISSFYDIPPERTYSFGDNDNDKEMLAWTPNGYAMKNAQPVAKKAAAHITQYDNNEEGVARELNKIFKLNMPYSKVNPLDFSKFVKRIKK